MVLEGSCRGPILQGGALNHPRPLAAPGFPEEETISSTYKVAPRFGPLGPTPFRDSRCTFPFRGLAQDCPRLYVRGFPEFTEFFTLRYRRGGLHSIPYPGHFLLLLLFKIKSRTSQPSRLFFEEANPGVALGAEKPPNSPGLVAVVNSETISQLITAHLTASALLSQEVHVLFFRDPIFPEPPIPAAVFDRSCFVPGVVFLHAVVIFSGVGVCSVPVPGPPQS